MSLLPVQLLWDSGTMGPVSAGERGGGGRGAAAGGQRGAFVSGECLLPLMPIILEELMLTRKAARGLFM